MNQTVWKALILLPTVLCLEFSSVWVYLSVQFSHSVMSNSFWPHGLQHASLPVPQNLPEFAQFHVHCISDVIQPSHPLMPSSPSVLNLSQHQELFQWVSYSHQMIKILELQHQSIQWIFRSDLPWDWLVWSPCCPKDPQESSPTPQLEGINSLVFCLHCGPALTAICDHWEDHSFDYTDFVGRVMSLLFNMLSLSSLSCQEAIVSWFHGCNHHP